MRPHDPEPVLLSALGWKQLALPRTRWLTLVLDEYLFEGCKCERSVYLSEVIR